MHPTWAGDLFHPRLSSFRKERILAIQDNVDEPGGHYAK